MSYNETSPIFPHTKEDKQEVRKILGLKDSTIEEDVDAIIEWFQKQPHLIEAGIDRAFVERMLIVAKGSIETTKRRIDGWYKHRYNSPEFIQGREKVLSGSQDLWRGYYQIAMPKLYDCHRITIIKFLDVDIKYFCHETFLRNTFMLADIRLRTDYFLDDMWLLDLSNTTFAHLLKLNPVLMQKAANLTQEGLGLRVNSIHIVNAPSFVQHVTSFLRQFFSPKIMGRVVIHENLESLHMSIPKRYLPKDYEGDQVPMANIKDMYEKELRSTKTKQFLINAQSIVSNEAKRPKSEQNEDCLAGSFRKLDFD